MRTYGKHNRFDSSSFIYLSDLFYSNFLDVENLQKTKMDFVVREDNLPRICETFPEEIIFYLTDNS